MFDLIFEDFNRGTEKKVHLKGAYHTECRGGKVKTHSWDPLTRAGQRIMTTNVHMILESPSFKKFYLLNHLIRLVLLLLSPFYRWRN